MADAIDGLNEKQIEKWTTAAFPYSQTLIALQLTATAIKLLQEICNVIAINGWAARKGRHKNKLLRQQPTPQSTIKICCAVFAAWRKLENYLLQVIPSCTPLFIFVVLLNSHITSTIAHATIRAYFQALPSLKERIKIKLSADSTGKLHQTLHSTYSYSPLSVCKSNPMKTWPCNSNM